MNLKLNFGKTKEGKKVEIDLQKEHVHTIFLTGSTGSGKSILHNYLYKQLMEQNELGKLKFVFMDMTRVDFTGWKGPSIYWPIIVDPKKALDYLVEISENPPANQITVIHIEECDMMALDPDKFEIAWQKIQEAKQNMYVIFSTSRPSKDVFTKTIKEHTDMIISCQLSSKDDSKDVLGFGGAEKLKSLGEKILSIKGKQIHVEPFNEIELKEIQRFEKYMRKDPELMKLYGPIVKQHASVIEQTLKAYGITVLVEEIDYLPNESVEYKIKIEQGTRIADILKRKKELALALASTSGTIKIEAPIPGRSLIGITVPKVPLPENTKTSNESQKTLLGSELPKTIVGKVLYQFGKIIAIIGMLLVYSSEEIEKNKHIARQIIVVMVVPVALTILLDGSLNVSKIFNYFLASIITWIFILGLQEENKSKKPDEEKEKEKEKIK